MCGYQDAAGVSEKACAQRDTRDRSHHVGRKDERGHEILGEGFHPVESLGSDRCGVEIVLR